MEHGNLEANTVWFIRKFIPLSNQISIIDKTKVTEQGCLGQSCSTGSELDITTRVRINGPLLIRNGRHFRSGRHLQYVVDVKSATGGNERRERYILVSLITKEITTITLT